MTAEAQIDELYGVAPADFTARRAELVSAARKRGDAEAAKRIAAARRPTAAAWVVNSVVRADPTARQRLADLAEGLRAAHASMDGRRIRELTLAQRSLIDELARTGFAASGVAKASGALRDDVVGTLQAAVADPDVAARLGRLAKAERWSGFGDFGEAAVVGPTPGRPRTTATSVDPPTQAGPTPPDQVAAATRRLAAARADLEIAVKAHAAAVDGLAEREAKVATARRRYQTLLEKLSAAEQELGAADTEHAAAVEAVEAAAADVEAARARLLELGP